MTESLEIALPNGTVPIPVSTEGAATRGTVVLAHGAGAGMQHPFLVGFAAGLVELGYAVVRFEFPYRALGRRLPGPAAHAITTWRTVVAAVRDRTDGPIRAAGKSYGGRMASMAAAAGMPVDGLIYLGYPLHAPGRPDRPRADHLPAITAPQLFVEGTRDPFVQPLEQFEQVVATCRDATVHWVDGGGHSFEVKGSRREPAEIGASLVPAVADFLGGAR